MISGHTGLMEYIGEQIDGYLVDYSIPQDPSKLIRIIDEGDTLRILNRDQQKLRNLQHSSRDSVVIILLKKALQDRDSIVQIINELMPAMPSVVGIDVLFDSLKNKEEFYPLFKELTTKYSNLVLPYSRPYGPQKEVVYPFGIDNYNDIPNMGYTNFGLKGKEVRYLDAYTKIEGELRPAFWTKMWSISHSDNRLKSRRRFINFNLDENDLDVIEIGSIDSLYLPEMKGLKAPIQTIKGKMVILGWVGNGDYQIVPTEKGDPLMPGIMVIGTALNTIVLNELSNSIADKYRNLIAIVVSLLLCFLFVNICNTNFYASWSNCIQLVCGILLFITPRYFREYVLSLDEWWTVFSVVVVFVLIAPAVNDCYEHIKKKITT